MKKMIFVPQPWANLICAKFVDAFDFGIDIGDYCRHVFVFALLDESEFPNLKPTAEWFQIFHFADKTGAVPLFEDLPVNKFVGCVELGRYMKRTRSIWTCNSKSHDTIYRVLDAVLFDKPIDENRLHRARVMKNIHRRFHVSISPRGTLRVPLSEYHFGRIYVDNTFMIELVEELRNLLFLEHPSASPRNVTFFHGSREKSFLMEPDNCVYFPQEEGNPCKLFSHIKHEWHPMPYYVFHLRTQI